MPIALLTAALTFAVFCAAAWLIAGGGLLSTLLVYTLSGNLAMAAILSRAFLRGIR